MKIFRQDKRMGGIFSGLHFSGSWRVFFSSRSPSFTLIELLVVMLIIVILGGITISVSKYANWKARQAKADIERQKVRSALDEYRAVYGEYPIVGATGHYPTDWATDMETSSNVPPVFRRVDLVNVTNEFDPFAAINRNSEGMQGVECLPLTPDFSGTKSSVRVDYRLTYPLKMRPESEGRPPFMDFPKVTVCFLVWRNVDASHRGTNYLRDQWQRIIGRRYYMMGDPVNRVVAVDPASGHQWQYDCSNGTTYSLGTRPW